MKLSFNHVKSKCLSFVPCGKTADANGHFQHSAGHTSTSLLFILGPSLIYFLGGLVNTAQMFQCFFSRKCSVKPLGWKTREGEGRGDKMVKVHGDISSLHILDKYTVWRTVLSAGVDTAWQPFNSNTALKQARTIRGTPLRPAVTFKHTIFHVEARLATVRWNHITVVVKPAVISQQGGLFKHNSATVSFWVAVGWEQTWFKRAGFSLS